jgi:glutathione S-transferase
MLNNLNEITSSIQKLTHLEQLHPGNGPFFGGPKRVAGAYALAAILDILVTLESGLLTAFPKLESFLNAMLALPAFDGIRDLPMLYVRE